MADEPGPTSIADRIAALKLGQVGRLPPTPPATNNTAQSKRPPPALPIKRAATTQSSHYDNHLQGNGIGNEPAAPPIKPPAGKVAPSLPPRQPTNKLSPALPPRRPSDSPSLPPRSSFEPSPSLALNRRTSRDSIASTVSSYSLASTRTNTSIGTTASSNGSIHTIRAPAFDPATLPKLPPKRGSEQIVTTRPGVAVPTGPPVKAASVPTLPQRPQLPQRPSASSVGSEVATGVERPQVQMPKRSALLQGFGQGRTVSSATADAPSLPARQLALPQVPGSSDPAGVPALPARRLTPAPSSDGMAPPPIPLASRPNLAELNLTKPKLSTPSSTSCLLCRDLTGPFEHASHFPRRAGLTPQVLAAQLCAAFPSPTDKALAIFAWLHHNIAYDAASFFAGTVRPATPASTMATGLAVCEGYAGLFAALAVQAGLEARVIGGHGKGFGYVGPSGARVPPQSSNHAWNVVRLEDGWKLLDPCWGAGHLDGGTYVKMWHEEWFRMSNQDFGRRHFPQHDPDWFASPLTWEAYMLMDEGPQMFDGVLEKEGLGRLSFEPGTREVRVGHAGMVRFAFGKRCAHWDWKTHGPGEPYCFLLWRDGRDALPFRTDGNTWWVDVPARELGQAGQDVKVVAVRGWKGGDGRGVTPDEFEANRGRVSMSWAGVCVWKLVH